MLWFVKSYLKRVLKANELIHDAIIMGVCDKYIEKDKLKNDDFGFQLLGRSLNWAIPNSGYNFENDLAKIENEEFRKKLEQNEDKIFQKGLEILNSDQKLIKLIVFYVSYEIYLINRLFPKDNGKIFPGTVRMKKFLFQTLEEMPDIKSPNFKEDYKKLFIEFNDEYGKYGKKLKMETINSLFIFIL